MAVTKGSDSHLGASLGLSDGDLVEIDIRGRRTEARVVKPPFVQTSVR